jgi:hypothetical protein
MPKAPLWYRRVPEILHQLKSPGIPPVLDRLAMENLFHVSRRQAIRLLGVANGYQVGKTFVVERQALIDYLETVEKSGAAPEARARKRRVAAALSEVANYAEAQRVLVRTSHETLRRGPSDLPPGIDLIAPGKLQISFRGAEDLLAQIVELAAAAANNFPAFRRLYEGRE